MGSELDLNISSRSRNIHSNITRDTSLLIPAQNEVFAVLLGNSPLSRDQRDYRAFAGHGIKSSMRGINRW